MTAAVLAGVGAVLVQLPAQAQRARTPQAAFSVFEASIPEMQAAMKSGRVTSHEIVQQYLTRIATYEDMLHAALTVNPNALQEADERDRERREGHVRGPLHGIPVALKDNIHTTDHANHRRSARLRWISCRRMKQRLRRTSPAPARSSSQKPG